MSSLVQPQPKEDVKDLFR